MAYPCDHGNFRPRDCPSDGLFVKGPEVFKRSTATGQNQHFRGFAAIEIVKGSRNLTCRALSLDLHGIELHVNIGKAALEDPQNVANRGTCGGGDDADAARQNRQRLFAPFVEEAFFLQLAFKLLEGDLERAKTYRLDVADVDLIFAARFIDAEGATHGDVQAILGAEFQPANLITKTDAANLRVRVLEREIEMARLRGTMVRHFPFDPDISKGAFKQPANLFS